MPSSLRFEHHDYPAAPAYAEPMGAAERARAGAGRRRRRSSAARVGGAPARAADGGARAGARSSRRRAPGATGRSCVAVAPPRTRVLAVLPLAPELRADPAAVGDRGASSRPPPWSGSSRAAEPGPPRAGADLALELGEHGRLPRALLPGRRPARGGGVRAGGARRGGRAHRPAARARPAAARPRARARGGPARRRSGATHPCAWRRPSTRLGASPLDEDALEVLEHQLLRCSSRPGRSRARTTTPTRAGA